MTEQAISGQFLITAGGQGSDDRQQPPESGRLRKPLVQAHNGSATCPDKNVVGNYTFALPDLGEAGVRPLRDPDAPDDEPGY